MKKILAIILATVMMLCCFSACDLLATDSEKDMAQSVAEVDISKSEDFQGEGVYSAYKDVIQPMTITKRELVAYFVNAGYNYISQGMTYEDTFEILINSMVNYKIVLQYAMVYFFEESKATSSEYNGVYSVDEYKTFVGNATGEDLTLKTLEYFLNKDVDKTTHKVGAEDITFTRYDKAVFNLKKSINSAIDSQEATYIATAKEETSNEETTEDRVVPTGVNTANADYYDPDYEVYTGLNKLSECGSYERVTGSTLDSRKKAYNAFLNMLSGNYLISKDELAKAHSTAENEGLTSLNYYKSELISQLQSVLSEKLSESFETKAAAAIDAEYLNERYTERFNGQKGAYDAAASKFEEDFANISDSSFVLYAPGGTAAEDSTKYGFVYNILLPFSTTQNAEFSIHKNNTNLTKEQLFAERAKILDEVQGKDQRETWFNGATDYSFYSETLAYPNGGSNYLFFEDSLTKSAGENAQYEPLRKYYGYYPYNGTVEYNAEKKEYKLTPKKLNITNFLTEMEGYMNWALEQKGYSNRAAAVSTVDYNSNTYTANQSYMNGDLLNQDGSVDYSKFVYYVGQVGGLNVNANNLQVDDNAAYTAMSAFNELQFAYSTDPGALSTYLGYTTQRFTTEYVGEFEYAAKLAISMGAGAYTVCPSDYGWHIIYCTYAFEEGSVYGDIDWTDYVANGLIDEDLLTENSFEYFFYQSIKDSLLTSYQNVLENKIANVYNTDACVTIHEERYSDYTKLENTMGTQNGATGNTGAGTTTTTTVA